MYALYILLPCIIHYLTSTECRYVLSHVVLDHVPLLVHNVRHPIPRTRHYLITARALQRGIAVYSTKKCRLGGGWEGEGRGRGRTDSDVQSVQGEEGRGEGGGGRGGGGTDSDVQSVQGEEAVVHL